MSVAVVTGSCGLIGSETVSLFCRKGFEVFGIDNNLRRSFFGREASVSWNRQRLLKEFRRYRHCGLDIRSRQKVEALFKKLGRNISLVVHAAAQPSHDWAARDPHTDFSVNATGTLVLLEACRLYAPEAVFIFTSTNKVYGDRPNSLPLRELKTRFELPRGHRYYRGIDESMGIDNCLHSLFGASKAGADLLAQEYGRYFGMKTGVFRGGCLTGPAHSGAELHGFLSYLVKCCLSGRKYIIYGYKGKQVRDNIHSYDLVNAFYHFFRKPRRGEVYNIGGGRHANCSILEAIEICQRLSGKKMRCEYKAQSRIGDHIWWVSDCSKFKRHYPQWNYSYDIEDTLKEMILMAQ
jgi:CDP-paratose 2-epimerase